MKMSLSRSDGLRETIVEVEKVNHEPRISFDLNKAPPPESESEEPPQQNPNSSLTLLVQHDIQASPNPNPQTSPSSKKIPLAQKRRSSNELNEAKKRKSEQPEAVLEVVSPPEWLDQVMKKIEGTKAPQQITCEDVKLILFEKSLSKTDVSPAHSRLLIPFKKLKRNDFLTEVESSSLEQEKDGKGKLQGVNVFLVSEKAENLSLVLKIWKMPKKNKKNNSENGSLNYALNSGWNDVVKGNGLKVNDKISLWSFRFEEKLYFALRKV